MSFHKITSAISMLLTVMLICSCDRDLNEGVDYYSPQADIARDTFEVARGENVEIKAFIKDESGIAYLGLEYADWNLKDEISVDEVSRTTGYDYTYKITVPLNALYEWDEVYTKHDGTKFNIKAYTDDQAIFTTLVSGSVQIKERESAHAALLRPDEQCIYTTHDGRMRIHTVDPQVSLGWIHGRFVFENETLEEILKQLGRWYDVKIFFRDPQVAGYRFTGNVGRFDQISTLLRMIEKAYDISFTISDDTVIVSKK